MLLGDVALGKTADVPRDTYMEKPLPGTNSTKALGTIEPDPADRLTLYVAPSCNPQALPPNPALVHSALSQAA
jgi:hypothetical protein